MASLNRFLCDEYELERFQEVLEVPLDGGVGRQLCKFARERKLFSGRNGLKWTTIQGLREADEDRLQQIAAMMARKQYGIPRGRLDVELWRATAS